MKNAAILLLLTFPFVSSGCGSEQSIGIEAAESEEEINGNPEIERHGSGVDGHTLSSSA